MTTYFYSDTGSDFSGYREKIEQYAIQHKQNIYMLRMPKMMLMKLKNELLLVIVAKF